MPEHNKRKGGKIVCAFSQFFRFGPDRVFLIALNFYLCWLEIANAAISSNSPISVEMSSKEKIMEGYVHIQVILTLDPPTHLILSNVGRVRTH